MTDYEEHTENEVQEQSNKQAEILTEFIIGVVIALFIIACIFFA
jgi:F0F1-type ATP synthase assembly protein I